MRHYLIWQYTWGIDHWYLGVAVVAGVAIAMLIVNRYWDK